MHGAPPRPLTSMALEITCRLCPLLGTPGVQKQLCYRARQADSPHVGVNLLTAGRQGTVPANTLPPTEDTNSEDPHHVNESNYKLFNKERGAETLFRFQSLGCVRLRAASQLSSPSACSQVLQWSLPCLRYFYELSVSKAASRYATAANGIESLCLSAALQRAAPGENPHPARRAGSCAT